MALASLFIRDFAIVRRIELSLEPGLSVLTGETGAGKSILIDALAVALGSRAESDAIRTGADSAEILAGFDLEADSQAWRWLADNELDADECIVRRLIYRGKPSKAFINGRPVTAQTLKELGELLVDIHGQHEHQSLLRRDAQRQILDAYAGASGDVSELAHCFRDHKQLLNRLQALSEESGDRGARIDLLKYQINEMETLAPRDGEFRELDQEYTRLAHANDLIDGIRHSAEVLYDNEDGAVSEVLAQCLQRLETLTEFEPRLSEVNTMLNDARINIDEAVTLLRRQLDAVELDPQRLEGVQQRIATMLDLARKHRCEAEDLPRVLRALQQELEDVEHADTNLEQLQSQLARLRGQYETLAAAISTRRAAAAEKLSREVTANMQELGMARGEFVVSVDDLPGKEPTAFGYDRVEFMVSANPGQESKPLGKVASGGELSRISLAIQVVTAGAGGVPTLIFDEVDVGIGGGVAEIVGQKLRTLASARQVLCITHLAQVAVQGHQHLRVQKKDDAGLDVAIQPLDSGQRIQEVARMLGGIEITDQTLAHAEDMLERVAV